MLTGLMLMPVKNAEQRQRILGYCSDKINTKEGKDNAGRECLNDEQNNKNRCQHLWKQNKKRLVYDNESIGQCESDKTKLWFFFSLW